MSFRQEEEKDTDNGSAAGSCLYDLLQKEGSSNWDHLRERHDTTSSTLNGCTRERLDTSASTRRRLEELLGESGNKFCADCGSPDPRWVSTNLGVFVCIKCSGVHRSLGVHISKVLSVKLDEWTDEQVDILIELGGNTAANLKYEACLPENFKKPKPDASIEERCDFIRKKYELLQFVNSDIPLTCPFPSASSLNCSSSSSSSGSATEKKFFEKHTTGNRIHNLGQAFRNSWRRSEHKNAKKNNSMAGMVEFVGLIKVNVVRGTNLAVRDMVSSDPYVILSLGNQSVKTRVIKNNLNPVWNEKLFLSIPENIPPLKLLVYDKDKFTTDDFMGEAEIDIQPMVTASIASEYESTQSSKSKESEKNMVRDGIITLENDKGKQEITLKLQNVESGVLEIELECLPLTQ